MAGDPEDESAFWEAYRLLGDCYKADLERLRGRSGGSGTAAAPPAAAPPETPEAPKTKLRGLGREAVDDDLARLQGHKLQQVLFSRAGEIENAAVHSDNEEEHEEFDPRACWLMEQSPLSPSVVRRKSLMSLGSRAHAIENFAAAQPRFLMFSPFKPFRQVWDMLGVLCITLELILNPLHSFVELWPRGRVGALAVIEVFLLSFWNLDILVTLRTAVFSNGNLDFRQVSVFRRYAEGWLIFDLIYVIFGWVIIAAEQPFLRLLQIALRLLRLARLNRVLGQIEGQLMSDVTVAKFNISTLSVQILLILHAMGCAWYFVGSADGGWVSRSGVDAGPLMHRYATSLYWMFCQMGFGLSEIVAATELEVIFGLTASIAGLAIFSFFLGTITSNSALLGKAQEEHRQQFRKLRRYLAYFQVDADLSERVTHFLERAYVLDREGRPESEVPLLALLSKPMQRELRFARYEVCLREIGFSRYLSHCGHGPAELLALRHLATHAISQSTLAAKDAVFEAGSVAHDALFLAHGSFEYVLNMSQRVGHQRWVSEMTLWTPWLHLGDLTTSEDSGVVSLSANNFFDCMRRWWNLFEMAQAYAREYVKTMSTFAAVTDLWQGVVPLAEDEHRPSLRSSGSFQVLGRLGGPKKAW
eukprot:s3_g58.t1